VGRASTAEVAVLRDVATQTSEGWRSRPKPTPSPTKNAFSRTAI